MTGQDYRRTPFDLDQRETYLTSVDVACGCKYDSYTGRVRRYLARCPTHAPMCRNLEDRELND